MSNSNKSCGTCAYATPVYRFIGEEKKLTALYCQCGKKVESGYICDRFSRKINDAEFYKRVNESLARMKEYDNGEYWIHRNPVKLMTNYRKGK